MQSCDGLLSVLRGTVRLETHVKIATSITHILTSPSWIHHACVGHHSSKPCIARAGSKLLLANRMARLFVVAYLVLLHLFVVAMLYIWSASGGSSVEIDVAALAPLMAPSAQARRHLRSACDFHNNRPQCRQWTSSHLIQLLSSRSSSMCTARVSFFPPSCINMPAASWHLWYETKSQAGKLYVWGAEGVPSARR